MKVYQVREYVQEARLERGRKAFWEAALESMMSNADRSGSEGPRGDEAINLSPLTAPSDGIKEFVSLGKQREQPKFPIPLKGLEVGGVSERER